MHFLHCNPVNYLLGCLCAMTTPGARPLPVRKNKDYRMSLISPTLITTAIGEITLIRQIGKGKSGYSFLADWRGRPVVFKRMHDEPCPYYAFSENKVQIEVRAFNILHMIGIPVPELLCFDVEQKYLVKTYCDGLCGHEWVAQGMENEIIMAQLFAMAAKLHAHGLNIDYFPANFVIKQNNVTYVDYEINPYSDEWSLTHWGIYYWANQSGMAAYCRNGDWHGINESADSGIPLKAPFEERVKRWQQAYG